MHVFFLRNIPILDFPGRFLGPFTTVNCSSVPNSTEQKWPKKHPQKRPEQWPESNEWPPRVIGLKEIHSHPEYGVRSGHDMDFALLELADDLNFTRAVRPACLPKNDGNTYAGAKGTLTGVELFIGSKVQYLFCFETSTTGR